MKTGNIVQEKSYAFALRIVKLYQQLTEKRKEYELLRQVLRSGTSIGANVEEAIGGQSGRDFSAKMNIAYKEARETDYWLRLLRDSGYLTAAQAGSYLSDCNELMKLTGSILKTMREKAINNYELRVKYNLPSM
jgi:four helix bundle protein